MKKKILYVCSGIIAVLYSLFGFAVYAHAAQPVLVGTFIGGTITEDVVWTKEASPYILTSQLFVEGGHSLTIGPGTVITNASGSEPYLIQISDGALRIQGSATDHVRVEGIEKFHIINGSADVAYADIQTTGPGLMVYWSKTKVSTSTFIGSTGAGIYITNSDVEIGYSRIAKTGSAGISVTADVTGRLPSHVSIHNSSLTDTGRYAIKNSGSSSVLAEHNWWGTAAGPVLDGVSKTTGLVRYDPWLSSDPFIQTEVSDCCSSVLFIPGLQASRLYRPEMITNRLWEPNRNEDVKKLFLDTNGSSTDMTIFAGEPIDTALGLVSVYSSFMHFLQELADTKIINEWRSFGYDWRMPIAEVVAGRTRRATTTESLVEVVENVAKRSQTGKVTLVAHSNGGLVAKYLVKILAEKGEADLIEKVISVAVPYLGTPQAILGLLHGDNQAIAGGIILRKKVAQELGSNMPSAYSLLPSAEYFRNIFGPTIAFASTTNSIDSIEEQSSYIGSRMNGHLVTSAVNLHSILDAFFWPASIVRWALVGWGNLTAKGISYTEHGYTASTTSLGDGTVVVPSASYDDGSVVALDLKSISESSGTTVNHVNILETPAAQSSIKQILTATSGQTLSVKQTLSSVPGLSVGSPDRTQEKSTLVISTHSPVELHVYDSAGRHTGFISAPPGADVEADLYTFFETNIPGSEFRIYGDEEQPETYISVPDEGNTTYNVAIQGIGLGEFTYMVERIRGGETIRSSEYTSVPVTPFMNASTSVTTGVDAARPLTVDVDGNGSIDLKVAPYTTLDPVFFFDALRKTVLALELSEKRVADILKRIDRAEAAFKEGKFKKVSSHMEYIQKSIGHKKLSDIRSEQKDAILVQIEEFLSSQGF